MSTERTLKEQALLERIAEITAGYEDRDANRRVEITELTRTITELRAQMQALSDALSSNANNFSVVEHNVIEGEVVEDVPQEDTEADPA